MTDGPDDLAPTAPQPVVARTAPAVEAAAQPEVETEVETETQPTVETAAPPIPPLDTAAIAATRALVTAEPRLGRLADLVVWSAGAQGVSPPRPYARPVVLVTGTPITLTDDGLPEHVLTGGYEEGIAAVDRAVDEGADLLVVGGGASTAAAAVVSVLTGREPVACVPRNHPDWAAAVTTVRDARRTAMPYAGAPYVVLRTIGGDPLTVLAGALVQAAVRRTPVILDGLDACAAGLVAEAFLPDCSLWWALGSATGDPAERFAAAALELEPLLDLGLAHGGGAGARLALPILQAALRSMGS